MVFKGKVYDSCSRLLDVKITRLKQTLRDLKESASNETKSTAGDKHETALAMLQIEQKNTAIQLDNLVAQKAVLDKIIPAFKSKNVTSGALLQTNQGYLFISIPLGKLLVDEMVVICLSPQSPLGNKLMQLHVGQTADVNGVSYLIEAIE